MNEASAAIMTSLDVDRLFRLAGAVARRTDDLAVLDSVLRNATVVEPGEIPPNVITMNSRFEFVDEDSQRRYAVHLVYPRDADFAAMKLSILTPAGCALLGHVEGQTIGCARRDGASRRLTIGKIRFQPEACGRFEL